MSGTQVSPVYYVLPQVAKLPHGPCQLTGGVSGPQVSPVYYVLSHVASLLRGPCQLTGG